MQQAQITGEAPTFEGSGDGDEPASTGKNMDLPLRTGLSRSKAETCCSLGHLAGDKGYHCIAKFYSARVVLRNQNRAHNRKLGFYGRDSVPHYGSKLMRAFEQCLAGQRRLFDKCCAFAARDRKVEPHFDSIQRKRYEMKMRRIRVPARMEEENFITV